MSLSGATVPDVDRLTCRVFDTVTRNRGARVEAHGEGDTLFVDIDLPGGEPASIDVSVEREVLTVRAERRPAERGHLRLAAPARPAADVTRRVHIADALDTDHIAAACADGVVTLTIPVNPAQTAGAEPELAAA
jgi:HSP20 family protein